MQQSRTCAPVAASPSSTTVCSPVSRTRICGRRRPSMFEPPPQEAGLLCRLGRRQHHLAHDAVGVGLGLDDLAEEGHLAGPRRRAPSGLPITVWAPRNTWLSSDAIGGSSAASSPHRPLDRGERPAVLAVDRLALDTSEADGDERHGPRRPGASRISLGLLLVVAARRSSASDSRCSSLATSASRLSGRASTTWPDESMPTAMLRRSKISVRTLSGAGWIDDAGRGARRRQVVLWHRPL